MRVLFTNPPWWDGSKGEGREEVWRAGVRAGSRWPWTGFVLSKPDRFRFGDYLCYPFFMAYAASYAARETGAEVCFHDSIALRESYDTYFRFLAANRFDYVFVESATPSWETDGRIIRGIHELSPESRIVLTGPITAKKPEEYLASYPIHACVKGEYEKGSVRVLNGESGVIEHDLLTQDEMNAAPFPYIDDTIAKRYWDACPSGQRRPHMQVWSSRGCPFKCIFCVWPATMTSNDPDGTRPRIVRQYSKAYMEALLTERVERYHYRSIYFDDDTFNLGDRHVRDMCEVMAKVNLPWSAMCRTDTIKLETWKIMRESGCYGVKLGFESGSQHVVDHIVNKRLDLEQAREVVHELKRLGMTLHGTFTYGLPGETPEQRMETWRYAKSLPLDTFQESGTAVIEGTPLAELVERGSLEAYSGAAIDEVFDSSSDGGKKFEQFRTPNRGEPEG